MVKGLERRARIFGIFGNFGHASVAPDKNFANSCTFCGNSMVISRGQNLYKTKVLMVWIRLYN